MWLNLASSWIFSSMLIVGSSIAVSLTILWAVRKLFTIKALQKHHDVAGYTFSIVGVLYSVILGFTVINVQERYNEAVQAIHTEAMMLSDLYRDADFYPSASRNAIRVSLRRYVHYVIKEEWVLPRSENRHLYSDKVLQEIWNSYAIVDLDNERTKIWYTEAIGKLNLLMNARLSREFYSWEHLSAMMWCLLLCGAVVTVCFMFLFGLESMWVQMLLTALLAGYLSFMLYLVFSLDHVFSGSQRIQPTSFQQTLVLFDRIDENE